MKYKKINDNQYETFYTMYNDEEFKVGYIILTNNVYLYTDVLFEQEYPIFKSSSLTKLKCKISNYYSNRDTIGKLEEEYPHLF